MGNKTSTTGTPAPASAAAAAPAAASVNSLRARLPMAPTGPIHTLANTLAARLPAVPSGPIVLSFQDEVFKIASALKSKPVAFYTLLNDFAARLREEEFRRSHGGIGSIMEMYARSRGPITSDATAVAFVDWLLKPTTLTALRITKDELVPILHSVYYAEGATAMGVRVAKAKYTGGASRRRTRRSRARRRRASRRH
jgi:hypothetical protein